MKMFNAAVSVTTALLLFGPHQGRAQTAITIANQPECPRCRIQQEKVTTIGGLSDDDAVAMTFVVDRDAKGRVYVAPFFLTGQIKIFEPSGKLHKVIGRKGEGPGEFQFIRAIRIVADTLFVFDLRLARLTLLDLEGRFIRSHKMPFIQVAPNGLWPLGDKVLVAGGIPTRQQAGIPLHFVSRGGDLLSSFGFDRTVRPGSQHPLWRSLTPAANGEFWTFSVNEYRLQKWDRSGTLLRTLVREAPWFRSWWQYPTSEPTPGYGVGVWLDEKGRLWTMTEVPSPDQPQFRNKPGRADTQKAGDEWSDQEKAFDTMVEVIDPGTGKLVFSNRIDQKIFSSLGNGYFAGLRQGPDGISYFDIWRLRLAEN